MMMIRKIIWVKNCRGEKRAPNPESNLANVSQKTWTSPHSCKALVAVKWTWMVRYGENMYCWVSGHLMRVKQAFILLLVIQFFIVLPHLHSFLIYELFNIFICTDVVVFINARHLFTEYNLVTFVTQEFWVWQTLPLSCTNGYVNPYWPIADIQRCKSLSSLSLVKK